MEFLTRMRKFHNTMYTTYWTFSNEVCTKSSCAFTPSVLNSQHPHILIIIFKHHRFPQMFEQVMLCKRFLVFHPFNMLGFCHCSLISPSLRGTGIFPWMSLWVAEGGAGQSASLSATHVPSSWWSRDMCRVGWGWAPHCRYNPSW